MVGRSYLRPRCRAGIPIPHHHSKAGLGFASPFWVQGTPPCPARHKPAAWYMVSTAAKVMLQAKGWFQERRRSWELLSGMQDTLKCLLGQEERPDPREMTASGGQTRFCSAKNFIIPGGREPTHRTQDLYGGLQGGCEHSRETPACPSPGSLWHCRRAH